MKLDELEKLADAATQGEWTAVENPHLAFGGVQLYWIESEAGNLAENICEEEADFIAAANPQTIKQLIALIRLQHRAIKKREPNGYAYSGAEKEALAAYEEMK